MKNPRSDSFTGKFYGTFKFHKKSSRKLKKKEHFPTLCGHYDPDPKPQKYYNKRKLDMSILYDHRCKHS